MSEQTNADLIAEARGLRAQFQGVQLSETQYLEDDALAQLDAVGQIAVLAATRLADRLEAAERDRDQLAAVVEQVRSLLVRDTPLIAIDADYVLHILASAPVDVLRERDARVWNAAIDAVSEQGTIQIPDNPYREEQGLRPPIR